MDKPTKCKFCGAEMIPNRQSHKYCSALCRTRAFRENKRIPTTSERAIALVNSLGERFNQGEDKDSLFKETHRELFEFVVSLVDLNHVKGNE